MGSQRESESVTGREGAMSAAMAAHCIKKEKETARGEGKAPGACVIDQWSRGESQVERSPANERMIAGFCAKIEECLKKPKGKVMQDD